MVLFGPFQNLHFKAGQLPFVFFHQSQIVMHNQLEKIVQEAFDAGNFPALGVMNSAEHFFRVSAFVNKDNTLFVQCESKLCIAAGEIFPIGHGESTGQGIVVYLRLGSVYLRKIHLKINTQIKTVLHLLPFGHVQHSCIGLFPTAAAFKIRNFQRFPDYIKHILPPALYPDGTILTRLSAARKPGEAGEKRFIKKLLTG